MSKSEIHGSGNVVGMSEMSSAVSAMTPSTDRLSDKESSVAVPCTNLNVRASESQARAADVNARVGESQARAAQKIDEKNKAIDGYRSQIDGLQAQNEKLVATLARTNQAIAFCSGKIGEQEKEIQTLSQNIKDKEKALSTLQSEISTLRVRYNELEGYTGNASDLIKELEKQIEERENKVKELGEELNKLHSRSALSNIGAWAIASISGICKTTAEEIESVQSAINKEQKEIERMRQTLAGYKRSPKYQVEQDIKAKEQQLTQLGSEIKSCRKDLRSKESEAKKLETEYDELSKKYEDNKRELDRVQNELKITQQQLAQAENDLRQLFNGLSEKITGETKEIVFGHLEERLAMWQSFPVGYQNQTLSFEIDILGTFIGTVKDFIEQVSSLQNEIDIKLENQKEMARMVNFTVNGILSDRVQPFAEISSRKHGEGGSVSLMYQTGKDPESRPLEVSGSPRYFTQQTATEIINQTFDQIQKSHNWADEKRQRIESKVNFDFNKFLEANPGQTAAFYFNELAQIVRLARADGNRPKIKQDELNELGLVLVRCGVEKGGNINGLCNVSLLQALQEIDGQFGENWCESQLKNFLDAIREFCKENNLDYDNYMSSVSFSTFVVGSNFIDAAKSEVPNVNARKQETDAIMQNATECIFSNGMFDFEDSGIDWHRFLQLQKNPYSEPRADYQATIDDVKWLAEQITDVALQQIGQGKEWTPDAIADAKKWVIEKFNAFVDTQGGQTFNVLFNRLSQLIRTTRIGSSILTSEALKELQDITVMCGIGGPDVRNIVNNADKLDAVYKMPISQAIENFDNSGFFPNGCQLQNFLGVVQAFCNQNGLNFEQCKQDVSLDMLIKGTAFASQCSSEINDIIAIKQGAMQWINWISDNIVHATAVPVFQALTGTPPSPMFDERGNQYNGAYVYFEKLCDFCENPLGKLRGVSAYATDGIQTTLQKTVPMVAGLIIDTVHAKLNIDQNITNAGKVAIVQAFENFITKNGDKITYINSLDQIAELIRINSRVLFWLPGTLNVQGVRDELLNVLIPYAENGGNLKELYQMPIAQAIQTLNSTGLFNPQGCQALLRNFLGGVNAACVANGRDANAFINTVSLSQLSMMQ